MAGASIKHIASFSTDGIDQVIHRIIPDKNRRKKFASVLAELYILSVAK